jgi:hypothetical protein
VDPAIMIIQITLGLPRLLSDFQDCSRTSALRLLLSDFCPPLR